MEKAVFSTPLGPICLIADMGKLIYCKWKTPENDKNFLEPEDNDKLNAETIDLEVLKQTVSQLREYFNGERKDFSIPYILQGTEFQKKVWREISQIGFGKTVSYKELADKIGREKAVRAVANACGANPIALIIPCHRVVSSKGKTGGYTGGLDKKINLLKHETLKIFCNEKKNP